MAIRALDRLNPRERRLVNVLGIFFAVALVLAIPVGLETVVHAREADNQELAAALSAVQEARGPVRDRQEKKEALLRRYAKKAPPLAGFLEQAAAVDKLEVENSDDRPDVPHGKRYVERSTTVRLKKASLLPIVKFLEAIEKSGYPLEVSRLALRKRLGEPDSYDVEVGVTAYDRADAVSAPASPLSPLGLLEDAGAVGAPVSPLVEPPTPPSAASAPFSMVPPQPPAAPSPSTVAPPPASTVAPPPPPAPPPPTPGVPVPVLPMTTLQPAASTSSGAASASSVPPSADSPSTQEPSR
jgi:general secretion pathway protein M